MHLEGSTFASNLVFANIELININCRYYYISIRTLIRL